jgi:hypothetical protein
MSRGPITCEPEVREESTMKRLLLAWLLLGSAIIVLACIAGASGQCPGGSCGPSGCSVSPAMLEPWQPPRIAVRQQAPAQKVIDWQSPNRVDLVLGPIGFCRISLPARDGGTLFGTGTLVWSDRHQNLGYVVTARHVFRDGDTNRIVCVFSDGELFDAVLADQSTTWDAALLVIRCPKDKPAAICEDPPSVGEEVWSGGYASGRWHDTRGHVVRYGSPLGERASDWVAVTSGNVDGDSGGPICVRGKFAAVAWGAKDGVAHGTTCARLQRLFPRLAIAWRTRPVVVVAPRRPIVPMVPFAAGGVPPASPSPAPPAALQPISDLQPLTEQVMAQSAEMVALKARVAALEQQVATIQLIPGPPGKDGQQGKPGAAGPAGKDATGPTP